MSEPFRLRCQGREDIPPFERIKSLVTDDQHLVLEFPAEGLAASDKRSLIAELGGMLPDYSVFDSGGRSDGTTCITIKKVIDAQTVLDHAEEILAAARDFRTLAWDLMQRLATKLGDRWEAFADDPIYWGKYRQSGTLDSRWRYRFHGIGCGFEHQQTGQTVEVRLGFPNEFGVLDPYFFARFVKTTAGWENVARLFRHDFHDSLRALEILEVNGLIETVDGVGIDGLLRCSGRVAR